MFDHTRFKTLTFAAILLGLALYALFGSYFGREIVTEIAILAILAIALDMVAGYGGLVSLCHGAFLGIGAYALAVTTVLLGGSPALGMLAAVLSAFIFGGAVGAVTARTRGIFFIMATLAFGQMAYVLIFDAKALGGDDGMWGVTRLDLSLFAIDLNDGAQFALFSLVCVALSYVLAAAVLQSGFGRSLSGIHENEDRMRALGTSVWKVKALAFGVSGAIGGLAGALAAQHTKFVSPELLVWTVSGEVLIVVILGGLGTLVGPLAGATMLVLLKHGLSAYTNYWHLIIGLVLIGTIMLGAKGFYGELEAYVQTRWPRAGGSNASNASNASSNTNNNDGEGVEGGADVGSDASGKAKTSKARSGKKRRQTPSIKEGR